MKRWELVVAGRNRAFSNKAIITPQRCKLENVSAMIVKWESSVRKNEQRKDEQSEQIKLTQDPKMTTFESMLPYELQNHLVFNKKRLNTFNVQTEEEVEGIIDARIGANIKEVVIKSTTQGGRVGGGDSMDVAACTKGKASGKGKRPCQKFDNVRYSHCGKKGDMAVDCWSKARRDAGKGAETRRARESPRERFGGKTKARAQAHPGARQAKELVRRTQEGETWTSEST